MKNICDFFLPEVKVVGKTPRETRFSPFSETLLFRCLEFFLAGKEFKLKSKTLETFMSIMSDQ